MGASATTGGLGATGRRAAVRVFLAAPLVALVLATAVACGGEDSPSEPASYPNALVFVGGLGTRSDFITPSQSADSCDAGPWRGVLAAKEQLLGPFLNDGWSLITAPVIDAENDSDPTVRDYMGCGAEDLTQFEVEEGGSARDTMVVRSRGSLEPNSYSLRRFLGYLRRQHGTEQVILVAHSMGGLVSRGAIKEIEGDVQRNPASYPAIRGFAALASPHTGSFGADLVAAKRKRGGKRALEILGSRGLSPLVGARASRQIAAFAEFAGQAAVQELSASNVRAWGRDRRLDENELPVFLAAGGRPAGCSMPGCSDLGRLAQAQARESPGYTKPNDGIVGWSSANAIDRSRLDIPGSALFTEAEAARRSVTALTFIDESHTSIEKADSPVWRALAGWYRDTRDLSSRG